MIKYNCNKKIERIEKGGPMYEEVQITEGGKLIEKKKMRLKKIKDFSHDVSIFENDEGRAVVYFKKRDEYILISIDMA